jgi:D-alanyl-lipoteichoic acid acyltransferase DltB (MBOAT superfamily)
MLLGGLWHGASWTFVIWGGLHGLYLLGHKMFTDNRRIGLGRPPDSPRSWFVWLVNAFFTFHLVCLTWIFFRAERIDVAWSYLRGLVTLSPSLLPSPALVFTFVFYALILLLVDMPAWRRDEQTPFTGMPPALRGLAYAGMLLILSFVGEVDGSSFIYFQF